MGQGESLDSSIPEDFNTLLTMDIRLNDPICKSILSGRALTHQLLDQPIFYTLCKNKPNNVRVLIYHMTFSIFRLAQIPLQSELPKGMLLSVLNSYLLFQRFHAYFLQVWDKWPTSSQFKGTLPEATILSSFQLLNHPQILSATQKNSILYHIKYEMIRTLNFFLMSSPQPSVETYPNIHFQTFDQAEPVSIFKFLVNYNNNDELFRISVLLTANSLAFCPYWQDVLNSLNFNDISPIFAPLLQPPTDQQMLLVNSPSPGSFHELVALFYQTLLNHSDAITSLPRGRDFVVALLLPLQLYNEQGSLSYFHSLILSSLVLFTSDTRLSVSLNEPFTSVFPCKQSMHRGTHADLLIEVITNTSGTDLNKTSPLLPAVACILHNIAAHIHTFSFFTCNRIFHFLQQLTESKDRQANQLIQIVVDGLNQIVFEQFHKNKTILLFIIRNAKLIKSLAARGINVHYLIAFITAFRSRTSEAKLKTEEAEIILSKMKPSMFMSDFQLLGPRGHIFTGEMAELWPDWIRTLAMRGGGFQQLQYRIESSN